MTSSAVAPVDRSSGWARSAARSSTATGIASTATTTGARDASTIMMISSIAPATP
jgi:hypothetical protein